MSDINSVTLTIDGISVTVPNSATILEAARSANITIPTLCEHPDIKPRGVCRICVVEVDGNSKLFAACASKVKDGLNVVTDNARIRDTRRTILELIMAEHPQDCLSCIRNQSCELQSLCERYGVRGTAFEAEKPNIAMEAVSGTLVRDMAKCIKCGRCAKACQEVQGVSAISTQGRSLDYAIGTAFDQPLHESVCVYCGRCAAVCPVGAIYEYDQTEEVFTALEDPDRHVIVQTAPAVRVALGDAFGLPSGTISTGKMVTALKRLGFDRVFDTNFAADLTIMEEGHEFIHRLKNGGTLPMITSCCPGWINYAEEFYPDLLPHLSSCKSPQQMFGAVAKTYYAEKAGIRPEQVTVVSIMPCTAKKFECKRPEMSDSGERDVDIVLTTRELARMLRTVGMDFSELPEADFDSLLGESTGAAVIFGASGGVMEAALRSVYEIVTGEELAAVDFNVVRGYEGTKEAVVDVKGTPVKVMVTHSLSNARKVLDDIRDGKNDAAFIEVMACPGGCAGGGGQPYASSASTKRRMQGLYKADHDAPVRKSHNNAEVQALYRDFLGDPNGKLPHKLLHTHYGKDSKDHCSEQAGTD